MWQDKQEGSGNGGEAIGNIRVLAAGGFGSASDEVGAKPGLRTRSRRGDGDKDPGRGSRREWSQQWLLCNGNGDIPSS